MKKTSQQKVLMMELVIGTAKAKQAITNLVPAFAQGINSLASIVNQINVIAGSQSQSVAGGASQKEQERIALNQITYYIISASRGYFLSVGNVDAAKELNQSYSRIGRVDDGVIADRCNYWITLINPVINNLADWGVTPASMEAWSVAIEKYTGVANLPYNKKDARKKLTEDIAKLINQGRSICKNTLDTAIQSFNRLNEVDFIAEYKIARKLKPAPVHHTRLNATVTNEIGQPYFDITVTVNEMTKNKKVYAAVSGTTNLQGQTTVREFEPGYRTITISGKNIQTQTSDPYKFQHGKDITLTFIAAPQFSNLPSSAEKVKVLVTK